MLRLELNSTPPDWVAAQDHINAVCRSLRHLEIEVPAILIPTFMGRLLQLDSLENLSLSAYFPLELAAEASPLSNTRRLRLQHEFGMKSWHPIDVYLSRFVRFLIATGLHKLQFLDLQFFQARPDDFDRIITHFGCLESLYFYGRFEGSLESAFGKLAALDSEGNAVWLPMLHTLCLGASFEKYALLNLLSTRPALHINCEDEYPDLIGLSQVVVDAWYD